MILKDGEVLGKGRARRLSKVLRFKATKTAIHQLVHRGGWKHLSGMIYEGTCSALKIFMENAIRNELKKLLLQ